MSRAHRSEIAVSDQVFMLQNPRVSNASSEVMRAYTELRPDRFIGGACNLATFCYDERFGVMVSQEYVSVALVSPWEQPKKVLSLPREELIVSAPATSPQGRESALRYRRLQKSLERYAILDEAVQKDAEASVLPWPPRQPTSMEDVSQRFQLKGTLRNVNSQITARLSARGYEALRYFSIPGGFALTTGLERTENGKSAPSERRWLVGKSGKVRNVKDYISRLLFGETARFRLYLFIVTNAEFRPEPLPASVEDVRRWKANGRPALSENRATVPLLPKTRVWLMVYEFDADKSKGAKLIERNEGAIPFIRHAEAVGL